MHLFKSLLQRALGAGGGVLRRLGALLTAALPLGLFCGPVHAALPTVAPTNSTSLAQGDVLGYARDFTDQTVDYGALLIGAALLLMGAGGLVSQLLAYNNGRGTVGSILTFGAIALFSIAIGIYFLTEANAIF